MRAVMRHDNQAENKYATPLVCGDGVEMLQATSLVVTSTRYRRLKVWSAVIAVIGIFLLFSVDPGLPCTQFASRVTRSFHSVRHQSRASSTALLNVFQVYPPVLTVGPEGGLELSDGSPSPAVSTIPSHQTACQQVLVQHSFGSSYGQPYVGPYTPPNCSFNRVTWNLTVLSAGKQFDRLGTVSFGDIELFRTSTAEPTADGISWTYLKVRQGD